MWARPMSVECLFSMTLLEGGLISGAHEQREQRVRGCQPQPGDIAEHRQDHQDLGPAQ
jgi:hypothetical protein